MLLQDEAETDCGLSWEGLPTNIDPLHLSLSFSPIPHPTHTRAKLVARWIWRTVNHAMLILTKQEDKPTDAQTH